MTDGFGSDPRTVEVAPEPVPEWSDEKGKTADEAAIEVGLGVGESVPVSRCPVAFPPAAPSCDSASKAGVDVDPA